MGKFGGASLLIAGLFLVFLGFLIRSDFLTGLLDLLGVMVIVVGAVLGIVGLIKMFSGGQQSSSSEF